jgi:Family of unknown function (DUF6527)
MKLSSIRPRFVEFIPRELEEGTLYISERYRTASHKCACGCGEKVVTPLSPADWQLTKDRDVVSLRPSIGNWNYACRSHYWIRRNRIQWASALSPREIALVQRRDLADKAHYIERVNRERELGDLQRGEPLQRDRDAPYVRVWARVVEWICRLFVD